MWTPWKRQKQITSLGIFLTMAVPTTADPLESQFGRTSPREPKQIGELVLSFGHIAADIDREIRASADGFRAHR